MSIKLAKQLVCNDSPISVLQNKTIAIDISPWLYKYMFTYNKDHVNLTNEKGVLTGHLVGFLYFLKNLKKHNITPVICLDGCTPDIKKIEVEKRILQREKLADKFQLLEKHGLNLSAKQKDSKLNATLYIGAPEKETILKCCEYLGIAHYSAPYVEGEKACAGLKSLGVVDECLTTDRDAIMYGVSFYSKIDFKNKLVTHYDYAENMSKLGLTEHDQLMRAIICSGCDYTPGIFKVGPKKILALLSDPLKLDLLIQKEIPNFTQILTELSSPLPLSGLYTTTPDPCGFVGFLRELKFSEPNILHFSNYLF
jgi:5'-3' exonuclease